MSIGHEASAAIMTDRIIDTQRAIAAKKRAAFESATPGYPVEYVGSRGEKWRRSAGEAAAPNVKPLAVPIPASVFFGSGAAPSSLPPGLVACPKLSTAHVIALSNIFADQLHPASLYARLHGRRVVDNAWVTSRMTAGFAIEFKCQLDVDMVLYASPGFCAQWPEHTKILKDAGTKSKELKSVGAKVIGGVS